MTRSDSKHVIDGRFFFFNLKKCDKWIEMKGYQLQLNIV